jgi:hypothetical protein
MAQAIYKLYLGTLSATWYRLFKEEQDGILIKAHEMKNRMMAYLDLK